MLSYYQQTLKSVSLELILCLIQVLTR